MTNDITVYLAVPVYHLKQQLIGRRTCVRLEHHQGNSMKAVTLLVAVCCCMRLAFGAHYQHQYHNQSAQLQFVLIFRHTHLTYATWTLS